jgi:hypothetical protein
VIILRYPTPLAIVLLMLVGFFVRPIGVICLVLVAITAALAVPAYIMNRREERTPVRRAYRVWEAHCRTRTKADLGKPNPVGDRLWAEYQAARDAVDKPE